MEGFFEGEKNELQIGREFPQNISLFVFSDCWRRRRAGMLTKKSPNKNQKKPMEDKPKPYEDTKYYNNDYENYKNENEPAMEDNPKPYREQSYDNDVYNENNRFKE